MRATRVILASLAGAVLAAAAASQPAHAGVVITGETATASSAAPGRPAIAAVNNAGITQTGSNLATPGHFTHDHVSSGMWRSNTNTTNAAIGQTLTVDFGSVLPNIGGLRIWNWNDIPNASSDLGIRLYDAETSIDNLNWTLRQNDALVPSAAPQPGPASAPGYTGFYQAIEWGGSRYVRFTVVDGYVANDTTAGFAEVMFETPEPASLGLVSLAGLLGMRRKRSVK